MASGELVRSTSSAKSRHSDTDESIVTPQVAGVSGHLLTFAKSIGSERTMRKGDTAIGMVHGARSGLSSIRPDNVAEDPDTADLEHGTVNGDLGGRPVIVQTAAGLDGTTSSRRASRIRNADLTAKSNTASAFSPRGGQRPSIPWDKQHRR